MENFDKKKHWETIYKTKELQHVSWYQPVPQVSLDFIERQIYRKMLLLLMLAEEIVFWLIIYWSLGIAI
jgi:hypothetical protein